MTLKFMCLFSILILLTSCQNNSVPTEELESTLNSSTVESLLAGNNSMDDYCYDSENYISPTSDDPMAICNLFPDPFFALEIAGIFQKNVTDTVTFDELAGYTGALNCGPGELENIKGIGYLTGLTSFSSSKNNLKELPSEIGQLTNLKSIDLLKSYNVELIPPEIKNLKQLEFFRADLTNLKEIPAEIGQLTNLKTLKISNIQIQSIPDTIGTLKNLEVLDVHSNNIDCVPESICNLIKLRSLDISYTKLKKLPENIGSLVKLERLDLFGCDLKTLPESIKKFKHLRYLNVYDNFELDETYKNWFSKSVYECKDDPENE